MTDKIFNLQVKLVIDDDRGRKQNRKLLEHLLGISTRIYPNCHNGCLAFFIWLYGISVAAGAFFAGVLIAESKVHSVTKVLATPIRDMFAALFFVSVGALMNITLLPAFIVPALILVGISISAKFITVFLASRSQGLSIVTSLRTGFGLSSSGGELALVAAKGGWPVQMLG